MRIEGLIRLTYMGFTKHVNVGYTGLEYQVVL